MSNTEVIIHQDVLEEDIECMKKKGEDITKCLEILKKLVRKKQALRVPYSMSPQELADLFSCGEVVRLSGCYGGPRECIEEYSRALTAKGVIVEFDESAIMD